MASVTSLPLDELALVEAAVRLGAAEVTGWSAAERGLAAAAADADAGAGARWPGGSELDPTVLRDQVRAGQDPLGEAFCALRSRADRRLLGQTFTPWHVIDSMIAWAAGAFPADQAGDEPGRTPAGAEDEPARVVDPGTGSARFLIAAGRRWPAARLVGVEIDPVAAIIGRASLAAAGLARRSQVLLADYRAVRLPAVAGPTLFLGNPPYVRHHQIPAEWKDWLRRTAQARGLPASGLAGLHVHFFLATAGHARPGDRGAMITAAEWLDVNYGSLVRSLLLGALGGESLHLVQPDAPVFADADATSVITCFRPGRSPGMVRLRQVADPAELGALGGGQAVAAGLLARAPRWSPLLGARQRLPGRRLPEELVELGELCRVHRGQVTGCNSVWVTATGTAAGHPLIPARFLFPAVTRARELFAADQALRWAAPLRRVIDLPADLGELGPAERAAVARFLRTAQAAGAADSYIARHRTPWWRVRLAQPPPILASYMARRPPAFVRNLAGARFLNIAHGLYPREPLLPRATGRARVLPRPVGHPGAGPASTRAAWSSSSPGRWSASRSLPRPCSRPRYGG